MSDATLAMPLKVPIILSACAGATIGRAKPKRTTFATSLSWPERFSTRSGLMVASHATPKDSSRQALICRRMIWPTRIGHLLDLHIFSKQVCPAFSRLATVRAGNLKRIASDEAKDQSRLLRFIKSCENRTMSDLGCSHLNAIDSVKYAKRQECAECVKIGDHWVHLRTCQTCGITLCCDSSLKRHASKHAHQSGHPVIASAQLGERWLYCYPDDAFAEY